MKPRGSTDDQLMPPWPRTQLSPEQRFRSSLRNIDALVTQAIIYLSTTPMGEPREPSENEREALECLHLAHLIYRELPE
jgi:hypothetical protein